MATSDDCCDCCTSRSSPRSAGRPASRTHERRGPRRGLLLAATSTRAVLQRAGRRAYHERGTDAAAHLHDLIDPAAHAVTRLPGLPADWAGRHWAGMATPDDRTGGRLFYWLFEKKESGPAPVIIWLIGEGPAARAWTGYWLWSSGR